ncbi:sugar phosphate nucleotidyltransferase [Caproiciproducens sp. R1]|uniref:sugar phosphate nucleotidyltransferase n=1 Tax=Caproiciproducens sp. R1 TaxID=3435000 RepID=UPI0040334893
MQGIVLCGGTGKRMWPYNHYWQKCCLPVGNVPNILRIVRQLRQNGVSPITLFAGYQSVHLRYLLRNEKDISILESEEHKLGDDIASLAKNGPAVLWYGDIFLEDGTVQEFLGQHTASSRVLLKNLEDGDFAQDHICAFAENSIVKSFWGHPRAHYANAKVAGIFVLEETVLSYAAQTSNTFFKVPVGGMPPIGFFLEQGLQTALEDGYTFQAVFIDGAYADMDFPWDILTANQLFCRHVVGKLTKSVLAQDAKVEKSARLEGYVMVGAGSVIGERVVIRGNCIIGEESILENGAVIGKNCIIGSHTLVRDYCKIADESVIGNNNKIGFSAEVAGVTFDGAAMVHNCEVYGVVGRSTDIAAGCTMAILRFDDMPGAQKAPVKTYQGINTNAIFLGDHSRTGIGNLFVPGVRIGANSTLGPGLVVNKDIPDNKMVLVKQETAETEWDPQRYGW